MWTKVPPHLQSKKAGLEPTDVIYLLFSDDAFILESVEKCVKIKDSWFLKHENLS